ncbi:hypothetical protein [Vibrio sp. SCSIO 43137]|uniref:hypothetical protein n=1 Tax=Vibrio sp. SCSIO 43137 TaxID=3021011 RepID=UPI002307523F|nr:hypothetical protein [Vibrio sp. SCSIO 43137]WCE30815.1 hypothetical protein PK654_05975 [Vibrio sp. SCSIO 43137]
MKGNMSKYYICSIGEPGSDYDDDNLRRCIIGSAYYMHQNCTQRGQIDKIKEDDVLILKYQNSFFAYGRASGPMIDEGTGGWCLKVPVEGWITGKRTSKYGIQSAQLEGNSYETVKSVERAFAREKISEIGVPF